MYALWLKHIYHVCDYKIAQKYHFLEVVYMYAISRLMEMLVDHQVGALATDARDDRLIGTTLPNRTTLVSVILVVIALCSSFMDISCPEPISNTARYILMTLHTCICVFIINHTFFLRHTRRVSISLNEFLFHLDSTTDGSPRCQSTSSYIDDWC